MLADNTVLQNRYLIIRLIAQGGMGAVYQATDQRLGSTVALKETFFSDEKLKRAFEREARLLAGLRHSVLPKVSDHFTEENGQFLVMEYISGKDLAELMSERGRPFSVEEVLHWSDHLLDALNYLHTQQPPIIHHDIKPQNLKLTERSEIVLLDFGLAKGAPQTASLTTSSVLGYTPQYAPLEQIQGAGTDARSDLYSLAATLYHLLTGMPPVDALARVASLVSGQPDPLRPAHQLNPSIPPQVAAVLMQAMAQNREQRPANAAIMRVALKQAARQAFDRLPTNEDIKTVVAPVSTVENRLTQAQERKVTVPATQLTQPSATGKPWLWAIIGGSGLFLIALIIVGAIAVKQLFPTSNNRPTPTPTPQPTNIYPQPQSQPQPQPRPQQQPNPIVVPEITNRPQTGDRAATAEIKIVRGELLNSSDIADLTKPELRRLRNAVYARHGRTFKTPELQEYFNRQPWYRPRYDYSETDLSSNDLANINLIQANE
ncbi:MAG: protein kinase [Acidobacteriota bacterium]